VRWMKIDVAVAQSLICFCFKSIEVYLLNMMCSIRTSAEDCQLRNIFEPSLSERCSVF